ncbi:MAG: hypothetical protein CFE44_03960 [Burkholderiales bacterium PBB4]|nr:MAG: hypothetical protein CFE44_03960 [Burkholderiales bacterium PBB4]
MASFDPMQTSARPTPLPPIASIPKMYGWIAAGFVVLALVPTLWPQIDIAAAELLAGPHKVLDAGQWPWVVWINAYIPTVFRFMVLLAAAGWLISSLTRLGKPWRMHFAFLALAGILGPGAVVNHVFKDNWQRARPYEVTQFGGPQQFTRAGVITDQCNNNCSFVSGHVACGFFLISVLLIHRKRAGRWAGAGILAGLVIGFARMSDVAHWLSDVLWACPITLLSSALVWKGLQFIYPAQSTPEQGTMH